MKTPIQVAIVQQVFGRIQMIPAFANPVERLRVVIDLDLCVQLMLTAIGADFIETGRGNTQWGQLWEAAEQAVAGLRYRQQMNELHSIRNLAQHRGTIPSEESVIQKVRETERFLEQASELAFGAELARIGVWSFVASDEIRDALQAIVDALDAGAPKPALKSCLLVEGTLLREVQGASPSTAGQGGFAGGFSTLRMLQTNRWDREGIAEAAEDAIRETTLRLDARIEALERDFLAASLGMPLREMWRFRKLIRGLHEIPGGGVVDEYRRSDAELLEVATPVFEYVANLCLRLESEFPEVVGKIGPELGRGVMSALFEAPPSKPSGTRNENDAESE